ncbi:hypothetical protein [Bradyrhizobium sp.]|uniref:hypothetical protein n=1 Tax=Bradyrhizobium sp. TaxID=376 RepID=UPI001D86E6E3|nr:hypothetical protein [Bradyrhizobium sp.]MBI5323122.1 hypothetical protein [Bradyrhizobium sp.]
MIRRLLAPLAVAAFALHAGQAGAQGAFPAPLPNQAAQPANASPFPPVGGAPAQSSPFPPAGGAAAASSPFPSQGAAPMQGAGFGAPQGPTSGPSEACMKGFVPLREEAERRGKLIKAASERKAPPDEACKLIANFGAAEVKMIKYIEANAAKCGIPPQIGDQMKAGHKNTEQLQQKVCGVAQQMTQQKAAAAPSLSEALGAISAPEAQATRKGGSTFDTLNGNVLAR